MSRHSSESLNGRKTRFLNECHCSQNQFLQKIQLNSMKFVEIKLTLTNRMNKARVWSHSSSGSHTFLEERECLAKVTRGETARICPISHKLLWLRFIFLSQSSVVCSVSACAVKGITLNTPHNVLKMKSSCRVSFASKTQEHASSVAALLTHTGDC